MDRALLLDEDRDDHLDGGRIVAWYRVDPTPRILRVLALGAAVMTIGSVVMASAFRELGHSPVDFADQRALWIAFGIGGAGLTTIVSGSLICIFGLRRVLAEERYLALRTDGLYFRDGASREVVPWEDIREVGHEGEALVLERQDGSRWVRTERFAGVSAEELARRVKDTRGKALFGLL
ncbi:MAG: hypothetical protein KC619_23315 [Myxococcales bacterium]|nr:hypothetical protein [Myxococcales bacterium]